MNYQKINTNRINTIIVAITVLKIAALAVFTSDYSSLLFKPFLNVFISGEFNPWQYYIQNGLTEDAFPYHALMLYIHALPAVLIELIPFTEFIGRVIFKSPLLLADLLLFSTISKMFPFSKNKIIIFYFLNPVIFYAIYVHSQLDIIPTALLVVSIYYLYSKKITYSAILLGSALATKFHILIVMPLLVLFLYRNSTLKKTLYFIILSIVVLFLFDAPYLLSEGFQTMVIFNGKQSLIFDSFYNVGSLKILLPVLSVLLVYFHFAIQRKINKDLLNFYLAALYVVLILFIYPSPGWYVWLVPFVSVYYLQLKSNDGYIMYALNSLSYLLFFVLFYQGEYNGIYLGDFCLSKKIDNAELSNIFYTLFEASLLITFYMLYKHGINSNSIYKKRNNLTIGIGGDSGVGKTTLLSNISLLLGERLLKLEGDGEHKWERGNQNWSRYTHLDPKANNIHQQAQAIFNLKNDKVIYRSEYDHATGKFTEPVKVIPKNFIAISGLHPFYLPKLRKTIDLKIYMDTDEKLRQHWKIIRDTKHRGYSLEKIMSQIEARAKDSEKYIHPQKNFSDLTIKLFPENEFELGSENADIQLCLKVTLDASFHLEGLIDNLDCPLLWDYNEDLVTQYLIFKEEPKVDFKKLAHKTILNVTEILDVESEFLEGYDGFMQYLTLLLVSEKLKEDR